MILKVIFANSVDPDQTALVCKSRFEKSARIFSRRNKQTTFSDAVFLGALSVNNFLFLIIRLEPLHDKTNKMDVHRADSDQPVHPPSLIRVFTVHTVDS